MRIWKMGATKKQKTFAEEPPKWRCDCSQAACEGNAQDDLTLAISRRASAPSTISVSHAEHQKRGQTAPQRSGQIESEERERTRNRNRRQAGSEQGGQGAGKA